MPDKKYTYKSKNGDVYYLYKNGDLYHFDKALKPGAFTSLPAGLSVMESKTGHPMIMKSA